MLISTEAQYRYLIFWYVSKIAFSAISKLIITPYNYGDIQTKIQNLFGRNLPKNNPKNLDPTQGFYSREKFQLTAELLKTDFLKGKLHLITK